MRRDDINAAGSSRTTSQTASSGISTFSNVTYTLPSTNTAETLYLGATGGGYTATCSSGVVNSNIVPAAANKLAFATQPTAASSTVAGSTTGFTQPVVTIQDTYRQQHG